jgi:hypothetical protein
MVVAFAAGVAGAAIDLSIPMTVLQQDNFHNKTVTWFASPFKLSSIETRQDRNTGCGSSRTQCFDKAPYHVHECELLFEYLNSTETLQEIPRSICLGQGYEGCCVSWSTPLESGLLQRHELISSAKNTVDVCGPDHAGQEWNVRLGNRCMAQCVSSRPDTCKG